ncbi:hypothetical protein QBC36DRAFT_381025 [Triangularia setosa]|uniref:Uncharacterized protein n=1 Tax=Triangularia setosa TaxID=2587417 RepID=A0AAN6W0W0_9PEZI|nr:hypothetical protein QBC36DRAFT_381025 [Podospora setosa]
MAPRSFDGFFAWALPVGSDSPSVAGKDMGVKSAKPAKRERSIELGGRGPPRASIASAPFTYGYSFIALLCVQCLGLQYRLRSRHHASLYEYTIQAGDHRHGLAWIRHTRRPAEAQAALASHSPYFGATFIFFLSPGRNRSGSAPKSKLLSTVPKGSPAAVDRRCAWRCPLLADSSKRHVASSPSVTEIQRGHGASPNKATLAVAEPGDRGRLVQESLIAMRDHALQTQDEYEHMGRVCSPQARHD